MVESSSSSSSSSSGGSSGGSGGGSSSIGGSISGGSSSGSRIFQYVLGTRVAVSWWTVEVDRCGCLNNSN